MSNITQFLFRRGNDASRQTTLLAAGEPGITTDSNRLFVGDGVTPGGNIAGNINFGIFNTVIGGNNYENSNIDIAAYQYLSAAQIGDLVYETSTNIIYALSATPNGTPTSDQLYQFARNITLSATEFFFGPNSQLNLANQAISGFHISPSATDQVTLTVNASSVLAAQLGSSSTGIANENLQYAPANSVKGNFTGTLSQVTDQVFLTGSNVYQFLGTASNTNLGVVGLSAGQNITFSTVAVTESNGQTLTAVVIDSTPNIEAGDGIVYNYNPTTDIYDISTYNSLQYIRSGDMYFNSVVSQLCVYPGDGTAVPVLRAPYNSLTTNISSIPTISFETVAPVSRPPSVTLYWIATGTGGSNTTVFATNSATTPYLYFPGGAYFNDGYYYSYERGLLFPSYWQLYTWNTVVADTPVPGWDYDGKYDHHTLGTHIVVNSIMANWPATVYSMYLSGTRLWLGGNFHNFGTTSAPNVGTNVRYGIACIDLLGGPDAGNDHGHTGSVISVSASTTTTGLNIINSSVPNGHTAPFGLTMSTPGYSVKQIVPYNNLLCVGGCWQQMGLNQPSTSLAIFDITNSYNLTAYTFVAINSNNPSNPDVPATIYSMVSAGSFLYVAGNFYKCKLANDTGYGVNPCAGLTRIKLSNCNTGTAVDSQPIGTIDNVFTQYIANQLYNQNFDGVTVWKYPIVCLDVVPNLSGGYILYAGGKHWVQYGGYNNGYRRYQNLTTHWIGNTAFGSNDGPLGYYNNVIAGQDGTLTSFNSIFNGPVNTVAHNPYSTDYNVFVGGNFSSFTSQRENYQQNLIPCFNMIGFDTTGYIGYPITSNSIAYSAQNGTNPYDTQGSSVYTSPDAPLRLPNWSPAFNGEVTGIDFQDIAPNNGLSAVYCTGNFTKVGSTKVHYTAAITLPDAGTSVANIFTGFTPAPWSPYPNAAFTNIGGKGTNILRIPSTNALSGVLLAGTASFNNINGSVRPGFARLTGVNESATTATSATTWCIASNVLGINNYINIDSTFVASLSDPVIAPYTVNAVIFGPNTFSSLAHVNRGDLCRFVIYRPGAYINTFNNSTGLGIPVDTFADRVFVLGVKVDWDTGSAISKYPTDGFQTTTYPPPTATSNLS